MNKSDTKKFLSKHNIPYRDNPYSTLTYIVDDFGIISKESTYFISGITWYNRDGEIDNDSLLCDSEAVFLKAYTNLRKVRSLFDL